MFDNKYDSHPYQGRISQELTDEYNARVKDTFKFQQYVDGKDTTPLLMELTLGSHQESHNTRAAFMLSVYQQYGFTRYYDLRGYHPEVADKLDEVLNDSRKPLRERKSRSL